MTKTFNTVKEIRNYIANNEHANLDKPFAVVIKHHNFYRHETIIKIIETVATKAQAKERMNELSNEYKALAKQYECSFSYYPTDLFTRGSGCKFAKQS